MKYLLLIAVTLVITACQDGLNGSMGPQGPAGPPAVLPPPPAAPDALQVMVSEYNEQRAAIGQELIQPGLQCTLYTVPNTTTLIVGATLTTVGSWGYLGDFNIANGPSSPGLSLLPLTLRSIYTSYYIVKCSGLYVNGASGFYGFDLSSDDGANLSLNGAFLNNDGTHGITTKSGAKYLARGVYSFQLDYLDIGGSHALILSSGGVPVSAEHFYH